MTKTPMQEMAIKEGDISEGKDAEESSLLLDESSLLLEESSFVSMPSALLEVTFPLWTIESSSSSISILA